MKPFTNEPPLDFSVAANREAYQRAIDAAHRQAPRQCRLLIGKERLTTKDQFSSLNPSRKSEVIARASVTTPEHIEVAVKAAGRAFPTWSATPATQRAEILFRAAEILRARRAEFAAWLILEAGKPWRDADGEMCEAIDYLEYYSREMIALATPHLLQRDIPGERNEYSYEAVGIGVVIAPWNFPLAIPLGMTSAALVAGNCVLLKPAEQTPLMGTLVAELFAEAGLPPGVLTCLHGGGGVGAALVKRPEVGLIAFTGSRDVGLKIMREVGEINPAQRGIKRPILEMGGKNAVIVDETADLDTAIPDILHAAFNYAGQKCSACSRVIVLETVWDALVRRLREATASLTIAPAEDPAAQVTPVIEEEAAARLRAAISRGQSEGEVIHVGDVGALAEQGFFVPPAIFAGLGPDHALAQDELFGPFIVLLPAKSFDEALAIANDTPYALTGGIESRTPEHIERAKREFHVGNLYINRPITGATVGRHPFGGFRFSGIGSKAGGPDYLRQFLHARTWSENTMRHGYAPVEK